jgi:hypothetical protein
LFYHRYDDPLCGPVVGQPALHGNIQEMMFQVQSNVSTTLFGRYMVYYVVSMCGMLHLVEALSDWRFRPAGDYNNTHARTLVRSPI